MTSIFERQLGPDFDRLAPPLRQRFGFATDDHVACVGTGVMERIWRGPAFTLPFLYLGSTRHILFPERGENVPFTIENYAYLDRWGRETVTFVRTFHLRRRSRRFDATMVYDPVRDRIVDYFGTHQHLAVELDLSVDGDGGLWIRSGDQRIIEGLLAFPVPALIRGDATVHEWFDQDAGRFRIDVRVAHRRFGPLFGYHGSFTVEYPRVQSVPVHVRPVRENYRGVTATIRG
jgi:hypothetical protein